MLLDELLEQFDQAVLDLLGEHATGAVFFGNLVQLLIVVQEKCEVLESNVDLCEGEGGRQKMGRSWKDGKDGKELERGKKSFRVSGHSTPCLQIHERTQVDTLFFQVLFQGRGAREGVLVDLGKKRQGVKGYDGLHLIVFASVNNSLAHLVVNFLGAVCQKYSIGLGTGAHFGGDALHRYNSVREKKIGQMSAFRARGRKTKSGSFGVIIFFSPGKNLEWMRLGFL